jgi:predicted lipoprotein with Yx(FWY)xxD motif
MPVLGPFRAIGGAAAALVLVAACSGAASPSPSSAPSTAPASSAAGSPSAEPSGSAGASGSGDSYQLATGTGAAGTFLTGEDGKTLYIFKNDPANTTTSACTGGCATKWPAFELEGDETVAAASGVSGTIGSITRPDDGKKQVTYNGMPLYYFASDTKAGDTNGQGVGNVWFIATP